MTLEIHVKVHQPKVLLYHDVFEGETGYRLNILGTTTSVFITEADGDKIARYMLFKEPEAIEETVPNTLAPAYSEPDKE